ncbi:MtrAB system accessory lipoprotein LpqB [Corynebacterium felinum]|uniref:Lipoprotein LpqB n=1 Tax=Corynebacterium felinum TaxID=131318 RepID=A0ABU2B8H2_9CORY|nr:MtrAB system accessory lipoprotein LpqB [Corynebacterium felinum]MDF5821055.1 MtrAB system accessory lipoprotein LpqB [Corynebacterium felinum]MDR7354917.1 hypothetical protein [Corynebacterium felinum]WJY94277.1 Lipoprotein LpqB precursor [Corynebacterium felinum]
MTRPHTLPQKLRTLTLVTASISLLAGCASLPSSSEPQALRSIKATTATQEAGMIKDREPDLLVRDFYAASANPTQQRKQARSYLTPELAQQWAPAPEIIVLDRIDMSSNVVTEADRLSYTVSGTVVGTITEGGAFNPRREQYKTSVSLNKVDGQWRISSLPNQLVVERTELRNRYLPQDVYFFEPGGNTLVSDRRWIYNGLSALDSALISLIVEGPSAVIAPGVLDEIPEAATFAGVDNGVYQLRGLSGLDDAAQRRLAAQLVWTLALADIAGPYRFNIDDTPLLSDDGNEELSVDDFPEFNPQASASSTNTMFALTNGRVSKIASGQVTPVPGPLGAEGNIESVDISAPTKIAAAVKTQGEKEEKKSQFLVGTINGPLSTILEASTFSRPTFEANTNAVWTVVDGRTITRIARSASTGDIAQTEVDTTELGENHGDISVLRLSSTGVRAAFIVDGRVYTATVSRPTAGERKLSNVREIIPVVGDSAITLEWGGDTSLLVGTASSDTPVWRAEVDGSSAIALSSGNIVAPVVSISTNASTVFITDARAALQLGTTGQATYWREVQGLEGERSVTIVPR